MLSEFERLKEVGVTGKDITWESWTDFKLLLNRVVCQIDKMPGADDIQYSDRYYDSIYEYR